MIQPDPTPMPQQPAQPNAMGALLTMASTGDNWVKLSTLGLIALSGVGNWIATWNSSDRNKQEIEVSRRVAWEGEQRIREDVRKQINDIHNWMDEAKQEFHKGNEDSAANRKVLNQLVREDLESFERRQLTQLQNQNTIMASQAQMLENDSKLIREIHVIVEKFDRWKQTEQMKGAP